MDDIEHIQINIADYQPHPRNYNEHPDPQVGEIAESLRVFGQVKPVVVWREWYIAGHGVVLGAQRLGWSQLKAERLPADWPEYKALAYLAADNELARGASPNLQALATLAKEVQAQDAGMGRLAAGGEDGLRRLAEWMKEPVPDDPGPQIDRAEELREVWGVESGQMWQLGEHRLICGDCTDRVVVERVMGGEKAVLLCTDPPYGVDFENAKYNPRAKAWAGIEGDKRQGDDLTTWLTGCLSLWLSFCTEDLAVYLWTAAMQEGAAAAAAAAAAGIHIQSQIIWNKNTLVLGQADYQWKHENCWYGFLKGKHHRWFGGRSQTTIWDVDKIANSSYLHPMQKPAEIYEIAIQNHTREGEICAEPFCGSGTQIVACERLGRRCRAVEISPAYCAVAIQRWVDLTGRQPTLLPD